jgi:hypothetical protein
VLLEQADAEQLLDHGAERHPRVAQQPPRQLGVEEGTGHQPHLEQARQVLAGGVHDPLRVLQDSTQLRQVGRHAEGDWVDQMGAGTCASKLQQVGALAVAEAVGPLGVDRDGTGACGQGGGGPLQRGWGVDQRRDPVRRFDQQLDRVGLDVVTRAVWSGHAVWCGQAVWRGHGFGRGR